MSFEDQIRKALDRTVGDVRAHIEADLRAFVQELARAAAEARARAVKDAVEAAAVEVRRQAHAQLSQVNELKRALDQARDTAEQQLADIRRRAQDELDQVRRAGDAALRDVRQTTDRRIAELSQEVADLRESAAERDALAARLRTAADEHARQMAAAAECARTDSNQAVLAEAARLAAGVRVLDEAQSLGEVLDTLADTAAQEAGRAAVLVTRGTRLVGRRLVGFGESAQAPSAIDFSLDEAGLPGSVVRAGAAVSRPPSGREESQDPELAVPPFARDAQERHALALPVTVGGAVVAVLYADAPPLEGPSPASRWPAVLDVLTRHASRVLEAMTVQQAVGLSLPLVARSSHGPVPGPIAPGSNAAIERGDEDAARRYARLLLSEIRMYHQPLVDAGRRSGNLLARLGGEIDRARRLYEARVPSSVAARAEYFEEELVQTLAGGDRSVLGGSQS